MLHTYNWRIYLSFLILIDASDTAGLLQKLTVGDNKTQEKEQEKVTVTDKEDKQAVDEHEKPDVGNCKKDELAPAA